MIVHIPESLDCSRIRVAITLLAGSLSTLCLRLDRFSKECRREKLLDDGRKLKGLRSHFDTIVSEFQLEFDLCTSMLPDLPPTERGIREKADRIVRRLYSSMAVTLPFRFKGPLSSDAVRQRIAEAIQVVEQILPELRALHTETDAIFRQKVAVVRQLELALTDITGKI